MQEKNKVESSRKRQDDDRMKVSVVTVCFNSVETIERTILSVCKQDYACVEHIIIDGGSTDGTLESIEKYSRALQYISEKDDGVYDAMNKGISRATGNLIVFLNSDDWFAHDGALSSMVRPFEQDKQLEIGLFGVSIVRSSNETRPFRRIAALGFRPAMLLLGIMPPHPGMIVKKYTLQSSGYFKRDYKICGDYEWCLRAFLKHKFTYRSFEEEVVTMLEGGLSNQGLKSYVGVSKEFTKGLFQNGFAFFAPIIFFRAIFKVRQFFR